MGPGENGLWGRAAAAGRQKLAHPAVPAGRCIMHMLYLQAGLNRVIHETVNWTAPVVRTRRAASAAQAAVVLFGVPDLARCLPARRRCTQRTHGSSCA